MNDALIDSLRRAVAADPDDQPLRKHLVRLLLDAGRTDEAIGVVAPLLTGPSADAEARSLMAEALGAHDADRERESPGPASSPHSAPPAPFDWTAAEAQVQDVVAPPFATPEPLSAGPYDVDRPTITLSDVGGLSAVKDRLNAAFLAPLANPQLRALYGKSLRGGLLMYGPPGCGKTFLARAVAGELGARFLSIGITDILSPMLGTSERNLHDAFEQARSHAPCVLFLDELDAIGQKRSQASGSAMRGVVNQLLTELDGIGDSNEGVFVLAATNQPWEVDSALRRPGRFDRTVLVEPPDQRAREAIFAHHLAGRPIEGIVLVDLAHRTAGYSGADVAAVCENASERALLDSIRTGEARRITMGDLTAAVDDSVPSIGAWLDSARNVVAYGNDDGTFAELRALLKSSKRL